MEHLTNTSPTLPVEYKILLRIRDLWANNVEDSDIRNILHLSEQEWNDLMTLLKTLTYTDGDNVIQYQKFKAKADRRNKELEALRLIAEGDEEIGNAIKCHQLEAEQDRAIVDIAVKLGVLKGDVIRVEAHMEHDVRLAALLSNVPTDKQTEATHELTELAKLLTEEGVRFYAPDSERSDSK